jgi:hypothetical protein
MEKEYLVYVRMFRGYKGKGMYRNVNGRRVSVTEPLIKVGVEEFGKDRVKANKDIDSKLGKPTWADLFSEIRTLFYLKYKSKENAEKLEQNILKALGPKTFWMEEKPSGITEFRVLDNKRKQILRTLYTFKLQKKL